MKAAASSRLTLDRLINTIQLNRGGYLIRFTSIQPGRVVPLRDCPLTADQLAEML
jgi:hypothetical protein